jgi:excinuclease ABC subunit B
MSRAIYETRRRREIQLAFNKSNHITPRSIEKGISDILASIYEADYFTVPKHDEGEILDVTPEKIPGLIKKLTEEMKLAANKLEFENAARSRDKIKRLRDLEIKYLGEIK